MRLPLYQLRKKPVVPSAVEDQRLATPAERARGVRVSEATRGVYQIASMLLAYPDEALFAALPTLRAAVEENARGERSARRFVDLIDWLESVGPQAAQATYVETFDLRRRCCLFLTYYGYGDTRRRGQALLEMKQAYAASGVELSDDELPDHLCVLLEFAATVDPAVGRVLLGDHRPGIELLRIALTERTSPYAAAVEALTGTFPALDGSGRDVVARLIASGPPDEVVGAETFAYGPIPTATAPDLGELDHGAAPGSTPHPTDTASKPAPIGATR